MTSLIGRPVFTPRQRYVNVLDSDPLDVTSADTGRYSVLEVAQAYFAMDERPIPLCDANHAFVSAGHINGYLRQDGTIVSHCKNPGKAPLVRDYSRFVGAAPAPMDIVRMFGSHRGNVGGVVLEGRIIIDIDPRNGGLDSVIALTGRYGPFPATPTVVSGGNGLHYYFLLPTGITVPSGGSLAALGYPGVEWKGSGGQVVLPPSMHESGRAYRWETAFALNRVPIAPVPGWLLQLILEQSASSDHRSDHHAGFGAVNYVVQSVRVQEHFADLWHQIGLDVQPGSGDRFYSCPFHLERHPSMHIDAQRCIWNCLATACPGHRGGGVRELEAVVGPRQRQLPAGLVFHLPPESVSSDASELGGNSYPNPNAADADPLLEELKARAKELFPLPEGQQPKAISRLCAFTEDPSRLIRHQVISNTWLIPANRALKRRRVWVHLTHQFAVAEVVALYGISISTEDWNTSKREALAAQAQRRNGNYAAFDNRAVAGQVRLLTNVPIPVAVLVENIDTYMFEALQDVDLPEDGIQQQRVHLVWLSQGWSLPAHEFKGTVETIAYMRDVDPVDDTHEEERARQMGLETWSGSESGDPEQWGSPRYFAVPQPRVAEIGPERAFDQLLDLAQRLGYQPVREVRSHFFPAKESLAEAA